MKIYVLMPLHRSKLAKIKERQYAVMRSTLTCDYSKYFGEKNEYYIDLASQAYNIGAVKDAGYSSPNHSWYYNALNPHDVIKKRANKS